MKVLIIDDNPADRRIVRYYFSSHGWTSEEASDGEEALRMISNDPPDLIISDALMPNLDGFQFLRELKRSGFVDIPVVIYTSTYKNENEQDLAWELGADGYMIKPKDPVEFWQELEQILADRKKAQPRQLLTDDEEYLRKYSAVLLRKLGEKVRELEEKGAEATDQPVEEAIADSRRRMEERRTFEAELSRRLVKPSGIIRKYGKILDEPDAKEHFWAPLRDMERMNIFLLERDGTKLPQEAVQHLRHIQSSIRLMGQIFDELLNKPDVPRTKLHAPLKRIEALVRVLDEDHGHLLDREGVDALEAMKDARERMAVMIDDVLELLRIQRVEIKKEEVDLSATASDIARDLQATAPERRTEFVIQEGVAAHGDRLLLRVVLENLLDNSWKFTTRTERPRISFGSSFEGGGRAYFVRDNGVGFDAAAADHLFSPFNRLHDLRDYPGTGIGLAILRNIVERHGGRCWATGAAGEGATFYFTLGE